MNKNKAMVKYMEQSSTTGFFRWPRIEDVAETDSVYVFNWDMDVVPRSNAMREWKVYDLDNIVRMYESLK